MTQMTKRNWTSLSIAIAGLIIAVVIGLVGIGLVFSALYRTIAAETGVVAATWITAALLIVLSIIGMLALIQFIRAKLIERQIAEQKTDTGESHGGLLGGVNAMSTASNFIRRFPVPALGVAVVAGIVFAKSPAVRRMVWKSVFRFF
ncbi:hypothetical protein [Pedomonas mirosovicensis]|uniref:hypothetical protein n=1 Tax=Pedomonas mirosovicensis TaxID=2908641 RepID=UPI00216A6811|nr:hypothetical protein [Pedomonas mirosovicensis]MCH8685829.1 hypothetical protein [Pedomonas mirosovicensis]